eukprot:TRINITY_DN1824_c0_g1_i1.p1 TRINITY_DN1824_c0_g1~~TRINITY_DN1824_c0_g1_i1.p1  ORF type:complete len:1536 (+),score=238.44 TRINITY_DN1824_c0_g1_i1:42-4649(+)
MCIRDREKRAIHYRMRLMNVFGLVILMTLAWSCFSTAADDLHVLTMRKTSLTTPFFSAGREFSKEHNITVNFYLARTGKELKNYIVRSLKHSTLHFTGSVVKVYYTDCENQGYSLLDCYREALEKEEEVSMELDCDMLSGLVIDPYWIPDLYDGLEDLTEWIEEDEKLKWDDILTYSRALAKYNGSYVAVPMDSDVLFLYYRTDRLKRIKADPPNTWDQYLDIAKAEDGMDMNGDQLPDYGSCISRSDSTVAARMFMSFVYPMIQTEGTAQGGFFRFDEEDMSLYPMVNNEAFDKALADWKEEERYNSGADGEVTIETNRKLFLQGKCALTIDYPNLLIRLMSSDYYAKDRTEFSIAPGSRVVLDRKKHMLRQCKCKDNKLCPFAGPSFDQPDHDGMKRRHIESLGHNVNYAPQLVGGWSGAVNAKASSEMKRMAYLFFSYISRPSFSNRMVTKGYGLNPFRVSQFSFSNIRLLTQVGMTREIAQKYLRLLRVIYTHPNLALGFHIVNGTIIENKIMELTELNQHTVSEEQLDSAEMAIANLTDHMSMADKIEYLEFLGNVVRISEDTDDIIPSKRLDFDQDDDDDGNLLPLYIVLPIGVAVLLTVFVIAGILLWRRKHMKVYSAVERNDDCSEPLRPFDWKIDPSQLKLKQKLATTTYGDVFRGFYQGEEVQVMQIKPSLISESIRQQIASEMPTLCDLSHTNVLSIKGGCLDPPDLFVVSELTVQTLYDAIHHENIPPKVVHSLVCDIARGMDYLHSCAPPILHTKLSSVSLLLDKKFNVKISNYGNYFYFGISGARQRNVLWTAPEVLKGDTPTEKSDVYSFGIVLWEILSCKDPYEGVNIQHVAVSVQDGLRPFIPSQWKQKIVDLIEDCWSSDPTSRPTFKAIRSRLADMRPAWFKRTYTTTLASEFVQPKPNNSKIYSATEYSGFFSSQEFGTIEKLNGEVAVLYTNIFGYTMLWRSAPADMEQALMLHNNCMRELILTHNGIVVNNDNDCFTVLFSDPLNAVKCAIAAQSELLELPWSKGLLEQDTASELRDENGKLIYRGLRVRMGIHSGELNEKNSSAVINVTTKITALAEGGEILVSKRTIKKLRAFGGALKDIEIVDARKRKGGNKVFRLLSPLLQYRLEALDNIAFPPHRIPSTPIPSLPSVASVTSLLPPMSSCSTVLDNEHKGEDGSTKSSSNSNIVIQPEQNSLAFQIIDSNTNTVTSSAVPSNPPTIHLNLYGVDEDQLDGMEIDQQTLMMTEKQMLAEFGSFTENWFIPFEQLKLKKKIGEGSFGEVWKAKWRGTTVAVKRFFKQQKSDHIMLELRKESTIMRDLRHPNILLFLGSCIRPPNLCIVTQYMKNGCVGKYLRNRSNSMPWQLRLSMVKQVSLAMAYLHSFNPPIIHRDLSSYNLLVDDDLTVKVADFGLCRIKASNAVMMTKCGTAAWTAPEVLEGLPYSEAADVYSYAIVLWEFLLRKKPYKGLTTTAIVHSAISGFRPTLPENAPSSYVSLIRDCWVASASDRPAFEQIAERLDVIISEAERDNWKTL